MELVLDASVIIKWFLDETGSKSALEYRRGHLAGELVLTAPSLLIFEVTNALCTKSSVGVKAITSAVEILFLTGIKQYPFTISLTKKAAQFSKKYQISAYDAAYLALAKTLQVSFITADEKLYRKVEPLGLTQLLK